MSLQPGTTLGPYSVTAKIGEGGMGEVYQARDTKLDRDVALKVLPEAFTSDPDRLARFEREAKVLASLNHPNIGSIYGLEEAEGVKALVLELIEGPTLADRIKQAPIPVDEALPIAKQIAEALEAAHEQGVIHRDLKPANVKVKGDGTVKVLDFGLAKALESAQPEAADPTQSPTLTAAATEAGVVLGTAAYMSPEQARGKPVDRRADIWAFGVVLFEMLTGGRLFPGETMSDVVAAVLTREPPWVTLPADTTVSCRRLLRRCLDKDPRRRLRDIGDATADLLGDDEPVESPDGGEAAPTPRRRLLGWAATLVVVSLVAGLGGRWSAETPVAPRVTRALVTPPDGETLALGGWDTDIAISPDGESIVFPSTFDGGRRLMVRRLDEVEAVPLVGVPNSVRAPFFSPDGAYVGFFDGVAALQRVAIGGGPAELVTPLPQPPGRGATWTDDGAIVFATASAGLWEVSADGGEPRSLTTPDGDRGERGHFWPAALPGGEAILFTIVTDDPGNRRVAVYSRRDGGVTVLGPGGNAQPFVLGGREVSR